MTIPEPPEIPTSTAEMLRRTRHRAEQLRRRRRGALTAVAAAVVAAAVAVPLVVARDRPRTHVVQVIGEPSTLPSPTSTTVRSTTVSPTSVSPTTVSPTTVPPTTGCTSGQLHARLADPNGAAGSVGYTLLLVNTGSETCTLVGYPGVSYVTGVDGTTVGAPAQRTGAATGTIRTITIGPGRSAVASLIEVDSLDFPSSCRLTAAAGLRIYPPDQTAALYVPEASRVCANPADPVLRIGPVGLAPNAAG